MTPLELADHYLARIERLEPELGAFIDRDARAGARAGGGGRDRCPTRGGALGTADRRQGPLRCARGVRTTFGSRVFDAVRAESSDEIVQVVDAAGAISLGKTNAPEFGFPSYTESLVGPPARNPWDTALGAGGSSGGAAVAVAAGLLPFAPGSDGGGSIRIPAAASGLVGLKPSRGRVPALGGMDGLAGLVSAGPIARTVADAALLLDAHGGAVAVVASRRRAGTAAVLHGTASMPRCAARGASSSAS